jgi:hypothetical protein
LIFRLALRDLSLLVIGRACCFDRASKGFILRTTDFIIQLKGFRVMPNGDEEQLLVNRLSRPKGLAIGSSSQSS